jgi:hypothetical protein
VLGNDDDKENTDDDLDVVQQDEGVKEVLGNDDDDDNADDDLDVVQQDEAGGAWE